MKIIKVFYATAFITILFSIFLYEIEHLSLLMTVILIALFTLIHIAIYDFFKKIKKEYFNVNETIEKIYNGNLDSRIISKFVSYRELNANLNRLSKKIEKMTFKKEEDELTIRILTDNMTSPIIYIDRDGRIRYVNNQFLNCFDVTVEINDIYEKLRIRKLYKFIDDSFIFETQSTNSLLFRDRYYQGNSIPITNSINNHTVFVGILFIFHDITALKKYEKLQREFLADASHELKTPLSAIKGSAEILLEGDHHSKETVNEFLTIIKNENERMERIVNDILLISRLENENILIHIDEINISELINKVIEILSFKLQSKNQSLHVDVSNDLTIMGDYERLKHAFLNLISNALNYTDSNKSIYINASQSECQVIISVRDEGIGIDEKDLPHVFERFYRVDKARSRETGGTGLGLAIVKSTLDIHKAKIEVKSKLHEGTEFIIYFHK